MAQEVSLTLSIHTFLHNPPASASGISSFPLNSVFPGILINPLCTNSQTPVISFTWKFSRDKSRDTGFIVFHDLDDLGCCPNGIRGAGFGIHTPALTAALYV